MGLRTKIRQALGLGGPFIDIQPPPILLNRAPSNSTDNQVALGQVVFDMSQSPAVQYVWDGGEWQIGGNADATTTSKGIVELDDDLTDGATPDTVPTSVATKDYVDGIAIAGSPVSTTTTAGIGELATDAEAVAGTASTGVLALFVTPSNLAAVFAAPPAQGGTTPAAGTFTNLTASGTISLDTTVATHYKVTGAADLTLESTAGSVNVIAGEAAADAVSIQAASGGLDVDTALLLSLRSSRNNASAIEMVATAGGIDISASSASAGEDIDIVATGSSVNINSTENVADSIVISSTNGGIDISALGASAGEDIDITATGSSINLVSTENAALAVYLHADGGASETIRLRADQGTGANAIELISDVGGVLVQAGLDNANAIYLHADAGTSETIKIHADQGTGVASINVLSDVGGINIQSGLGSADAININASAAGGGIDVDAGTAGVIVDTTGAISLDAAAASNLTVTGAFALDVITTLGKLRVQSGQNAADSVEIKSLIGGIDILAAGAGAGEDIDIIATGSSVNINSTENAADSIVISSTNGGIDILCPGAGAGEDIDIVATGSSVNISATENDAGAITIGTNGGTSEKITVTCSQGTNAASIGLVSTAGGVTITGGLATADAININTSAAGGGIDIDAGTQGFIVDTTGAISLDSATASNFTVTGAADLTLSSSAGAVNVTSGETNADSINVTSGGGMNIVATGAAAKDTIITNTNGSITITAGESVSDAFNLTASGAASKMTLTAGTAGISLQSGIVVKVTSVAAAATPYTVLGTDYFITTDTTGGVLTLTLPAAPATGRMIVVYDGVGQAAANNVTIDGNGKSIAFAGTAAGTKPLNTAYESATLVYNGTLWCAQDVV